MFSLVFFLVNAIVWQEDFTTARQTMAQLYEYTIDITQQDGKVILKGNPQFEGSSTAWFYLDKEMIFDNNDVLEIVLRVKCNRARINYFYRRKDSPVYFGGEVCIDAKDEWQRIEIPFRDARPCYSSNFPFALTPHKLPGLYLFVDNLLPGNFEVEIDKILVRTEEEQ